MEVNKEFEKFKCFNFQKVKHENEEYLALEGFSINEQDIFNNPIHRFEVEIEPFIEHYSKLLGAFNSKIYNIYVKEEKFLFDTRFNKVNLIHKHFKNISRIAEHLKIVIIIPTYDGYNLSYYLINDLLYEITERISFLDKLKLHYKPYLKFNNENEYKLDLSGFATTVKLRTLESLSVTEWTRISLNRTMRHEPSYSDNLCDDTVSFQDAIKPEAKDDFEKLYQIFCIDEPDTKVSDIVLFFKIMKTKGYFKNKLESGKRINTDMFHQIVLDKTKRDIAYNTFRNNGKAQFENYLFEKPNIPKFK